MPTETLQDLIKRELPAILRSDPEFRAYVLELTRTEYAGRAETQDWFHEMLGELRRDPEEQTRKWEANQAELRALREEQERKWAESKAEDARKWAESKAEDARKWEENRREFDKVHEEIMAQAKKFDRSIGALGARWGLQSKRTFRNALAGILTDHFGVTVENVTEYDAEGAVFGRPDQVELDIIIQNGLLLILELKSSIDKAGMYVFERKARFYERRHDRRADRLIVVAPMIDPPAQAVAEALGIETFSDAVEVRRL